MSKYSSTIKSDFGVWGDTSTCLPYSMRIDNSKLAAFNISRSGFYGVCLVLARRYLIGKRKEKRKTERKKKQPKEVLQQNERVLLTVVEIYDPQ